MIPKAEAMYLEEQMTARIESELEVRAYIQNLKYALENGAQISFQIHRMVDNNRPEEYTNAYTIASLFPKEDPIKALRRELKKISIEDYMRTVRDLRFPERSEMREFGKVYNGSSEVYIKIRVELLGVTGEATTFVMSFHYAEKPFQSEMFPYKSRRNDINGNADYR